MPTNNAFYYYHQPCNNATNNDLPDREVEGRKSSLPPDQRDYDRLQMHWQLQKQPEEHTETILANFSINETQLEVVFGVNSLQSQTHFHCNSGNFAVH